MARDRGSAPATARHRPAATPRPTVPADNAAVAARLLDYADLLDQQGADGFRARAYRRAAEVVSGLDRSVAEILASEGRRGLIALPAIGVGIAGAIEELTTTGHWAQSERLRGELVPAALFMTLPGIGPKLARRMSEDGELESLEDLESALHRGTPRIAGLGPRRRRMLEAVVAERLGRTRLGGRVPAPTPPVALILEVDRLYREKAAAGELRRIAPRRFNPAHEAWLPVLHARHDDWHFTALFSNTAKAHELGRTGDWVVVYFQQDGHPEGRCTVVTERRGPNAGRRVVRGREAETP